MKEVLDLFIQEYKDKNYDKYDIKIYLKKYLKETMGINVDFRVCGYKEILDYVYKKIFWWVYKR